MNFNQKTGFLAKLLDPMSLSKNFDDDLKLNKHRHEIISRLNETDSKKVALYSSLGKSTTADFIKQIFNETEKCPSANLDCEGEKISPLKAYAASFKQRWTTDCYLTILKEDNFIEYFDSISFDYLLLNNLFGSPQNILEDKKSIKEALNLCPDITLLINADEPNFYDIDKENKVKKIYFGFNSVDFAKNCEEIAGENDLKCPICYLSELSFEKRYYSHIGKYECRCGFKRPKLDISADVKVFNNYSLMSVYYKNDKSVYKIPIGGIYNAYNALCAISFCLIEGIKRKQITNTLEKYCYLKARDEIKTCRDKTVKIKLIKDDVSITQAIRELYHQKDISVIFAIDSKNVDFIKGAALEALKGNDNNISIISENNDIAEAFIQKEVQISQTSGLCKNIIFNTLKQNDIKNVLILTDEILVKEVYKNLDNVCNN